MTTSWINIRTKGTHKGSKIGLLLLWLTTLLMTILTTDYYQKHRQQDALKIELNHLEGQIRQELQRFQRLPRIIAEHPGLLQAIGHPPGSKASEQTSQLLSTLNTLQGSNVTYLLNRQGLTLASSNYQQADSFVGTSYAFRPYFKAAIKGEDGQYFALGSRSGKRGYYFSAPVYHQHKIMAVLVIKVRFNLLDSSWKTPRFDYLITDYHSVIFYATQPHWLYHTLYPIKESLRKTIKQSRQYGSHPLKQLISHTQSDMPFIMPNENNQSQAFLVEQHKMTQPAWELYTMTPKQWVWQPILQACFLTSLIFLVLVLLINYGYQLRARRQLLARLNMQLEARVNHRTRQLTLSNQQLKEAIQKYHQTNKTLRQTEAELMQTAKLAMLGELSASLNHELNQPLTALLTYAENSQRLLRKNKNETVQENLTQIIRVADLMRAIIARFKVFARKSKPLRQSTPVHSVIKAALALLHNKMIKQGVIAQLDLQVDLWVHADPVQLEQVLINLLNNALEALKETSTPQIQIRSWQDKEQIFIKVKDNGCGFKEIAAESLFEPFFTTKAKGLGLGTTISRRIIESFNGQLSAYKNADKGAYFIIQLPQESTREE
ncbi:MAG: C4-dicarboxylate transport sensor protein DctB [Candidatus Celerinatantimonas neptuna]|nr:MAG: C4-dicarboxylate transport sensor protein DctB [Candidatus Celerinatantimonas neptuna]